ncbi:hypothetical protein L0156_24720 [bacterium]|nr:hypothetical protein [bacterium]
MARIKEFIKLPGKRIFSMGFARNSLWLGKDHLLHVINRGYSEEYRRFYYRDIQAILVRETSLGKTFSIILGIIAGVSLLFLALGWFVWRWETFALIPMGIAAFLWLVLFVVQIASGPTCICHLRTAVQFEQLPSLRRVRSARKAIAMLRQRVEAAQGPFATVVPLAPQPRINTNEQR